MADGGGHSNRSGGGGGGDVGGVDPPTSSGPPPLPSWQPQADQGEERAVREKEEERDMAPLQRSGSRPQLDLSGAEIQGNFDDRNPTILLPNQSDDISHLALDIGGWCVCVLCATDCLIT